MSVSECGPDESLQFERECVASSDAQLREAAVQLGVLGVPLERFDPWGVPNPFRPSAADPAPVPKKKRALRLQPRPRRQPP